MTVFERTYRELERLKGVSLHESIMRYTVAPERTEQQRQIWSDAHLRAHFNEKSKPWKLKTAIAAGLIGFWWYEFFRMLMGWIG